MPAERRLTAPARRALFQELPVAGLVVRLVSMRVGRSVSERALAARAVSPYRGPPHWARLIVCPEGRFAGDPGGTRARAVSRTYERIPNGDGWLAPHASAEAMARVDTVAASWTWRR
jgi:hypothetical protein